MEKKPNLRLRLKISVAFIWIGALLALLSKALGGWLLWVGIGIVCLSAVYRYTAIRCPHCGQPLIYGKTIPAKCPNCGEALL